MKFTIKTVRRVNFFVVGSLSGAYIFSQHLIKNIIREKMELKIGDTVVPVPAGVQNLVEEVRQDMKLKINVTPFMSKAADVRSICGPLSSTEVYIGIPEYYLNDDNDDTKCTVKVNDKEVPKNNPLYYGLKRALTLSTEAKKFGIAQELYLSQFSSIIPSCVLPLLIIGNCNALTVIMEKLEKRPIHVLNYFFVYFLGVCAYIILYDALSSFRECQSDLLATDLGKHYIKGGIEYYEKTIKRNALFKKFAKTAPSKRDIKEHLVEETILTEEEEDLNLLLRMYHMPLDKRVKYLKNINKGVKESALHYLLFD